MNASTIKSSIQAEKPGLVLDLGSGTSGKWVLSDLKSSKLTFRYLDSGANKLVFRVYNSGTPTDWVLAFQHIPGDTMARQLLEGEIRVLKRLASHHVIVPQPIGGDANGNHVFDFHLDNLDSHAGVVYGYIMEYLDIRRANNPNGRWVEMSKKEGDLPNWLQSKILSVLPGAKGNLHNTIQTFDVIRTQFEADPWSDFQVMYDSTNGNLMVLDPWDEPHKATLDTYKEKIVILLKKWKDDLDKASAK